MPRDTRRRSTERTREPAIGAERSFDANVMTTTVRLRPHPGTERPQETRLQTRCGHCDGGRTPLPEALARHGTHTGQPHHPAARRRPHAQEKPIYLVTAVVHRPLHEVAGQIRRRSGRTRAQATRKADRRTWIKRVLSRRQWFASPRNSSRIRARSAHLAQRRLTETATQATGQTINPASTLSLPNSSIRSPSAHAPTHGRLAQQARRGTTASWMIISVICCAAGREKTGSSATSAASSARTGAGPRPSRCPRAACRRTRTLRARPDLNRRSPSRSSSSTASLCISLSRQRRTGQGTVGGRRDSELTADLQRSPL